jgi:hypothetical protein
VEGARARGRDLDMEEATGAQSVVQGGDASKSGGVESVLIGVQF